jgi:hypothetical protein
MKKLIFMVMTAVALLMFAACGGNRDAERQQSQNQPPTQTENEDIPQAPTETQANYTGANETDIMPVMESLAGEWEGMGLWFQFYADGTWIGNTGDTRWRGNIGMTPKGDSYIVELVANYIGGPGGMHDSDGNLRKEALELIESGEHDWWLPVYNNEPFTLLSGTYAIHNDRFVSQDAAGNSHEMERCVE